MNCLPEAFHYAPTLVEVNAPSAMINFEEIFGPVLGLEFYADIDDAIARANASNYGLTASVFAADSAAIRAFEDGIEAGMVHVNHGTFPDENMPFGGWKDSGVGAPSVGGDADQFFTRIQAVYEGI
ncbi:MAG: aldehyde dehydrogenase family protein [Salaquimonas sp.]